MIHALDNSGLRLNKNFIMFEELRLEISFKNIEQMKMKIDFLQNNNISKINIPCKGLMKKDFLLEIVEYIGKNYPSLDVVYHYSLYHQYTKNNLDSYKYFVKFIEKCVSFNNKEILLISGSKKKNGFDVTDVLDKINKDINTNIINFGIAYNPFFSNNKDIEDERNRLLEKLSSGIINSIWLQLGSDVYLLKKGILFLNETIKNNIKYSDGIKVYGSLFVPSKQSLSRFKFRPWKGVFFSNDYLYSLEKAKKITFDILKFYKANKIDLLIESECTTKKQLVNARNILDF